ncbi:MAG: helix-turn-helix domain-containing protein [Nitrososphaeraceae archaeon]|nr:helix-turn-helix domain-containing protein [Nitrososphaeraceae archaeon]
MRHYTKLDKIYNQESNADIKERIQLVRRIIQDKQHIEDVAKELHRCRAWAYKWYKRYNENGLEGLKDQPRTGRPPDVPKETMLKIKNELAESNAGWDFRQVMDLIYNKTGVRYHEVHIHRLLHKWGFKSKVPKKRFVNTVSTKEKKSFKKE